MHKLSFHRKAIFILLGVLLSLAMLEIGIHFSESLPVQLNHYKNIWLAKNKGAYCILALGDCTTALGGSYSWPAQLEEALNARNIGVRFKVINKGRTDTDTAVIVSKLDSLLYETNPDMVVVMTGINDGIRNAPYNYSEALDKNEYFSRVKIYNLMTKVWSSIINKIKKPGNSSKGKMPKDGYSRLINKGNFYISRRKYKEAEEIFNQIIEINPQDDEAYVKLAHCYKKTGMYSQAVDMLKRAIMLNPANYKAYVELGDSYNSHNIFAKAEQMYKRAIELAPRNSGVYMMLGYCYRDQRKHEQTEAMFKEAIAITPRSDWAYGELGNLYSGLKRYAEAEEMYQKAIGFNPKDTNIYIQLGNCYIQQNDIKGLEKLLAKAKKENLYDDRLYGLEATYYTMQRQYGEAEKYYKKANEFRAKYYNPLTYHNYIKLKKMVTENGIRLVCMQYPVRSIAPLEKLLGSSEGIIFINNERIFKDALKIHRYEAIFTTNFAGDFGNLTPYGNKLIAENAANVIIKEVFKKK